MPGESKDSTEKRDKRLLADRFEILEAIGSGGISTVYKARDLVLGRVVAVKVLRSDRLSDDNLVRLQREARAICKLRQTNIVDVFDFTLDSSNDPVLTMEFVSGVSLSEIIEKKGPIDELAACELFEQICEAMEYAHRYKILHRDLKPGNVLVQDFDTVNVQVKIIDFGIAKLLDLEEGTVTGSGSIVGTPSFMSPEQAQGRTVDHRSDVYSLGCLMYKTLTGHTPFRGTAPETLTKQVNQPAPTLREGNSTVDYSDEIETLVRKALSKDPNNRFQTMSDLKSAIQALRSAGDTDPVETDFASKKTPGLLNSRAIAIVSFLILLVAAPLAIFSILTREDPEDRRMIELMELKRKYNIRERFTKRHKWHDLEGRVTDERLVALQKLKVHRLDLSKSSVSDNQLRLIKNLPLVMLDIRDTQLTDAAIDHILQIKGLRALLIERCPRIDHAGFRKISKMKSLEILSLRDTSLADDDLMYIATLPKLLLLYVSNSPNITDAAVESILSLENLRSVRVGGTKITRAGIEKLQKHPSLIFMGFRNSGLTDDRLPSSFSQELRMLDLSMNPISDRSIAKILALKKLWYINVKNCPNISMRGRKILGGRYNYDTASVALIDGGPERVEIEWYLDPEIYESTPVDSFDFRKKMIYENLFSDGTDVDD